MLASPRRTSSATEPFAFSTCRRRSSGDFTGVPFTAVMTSPGRMPARAAGPPTCSTTTPCGERSYLRSLGRREAEGRRERGIEGLDADADGPALDLAGLEQLLRHIRGHVDRDRERDAHVAAGARVDRGGHADHVAAHVEERPARVPRV